MNGAQNTNDIMEILAPPADGDTLSRLHRLLESKAERDGVLDVAYTVVDSPVGRLMLAATTRGLVRVAYATEDHDRVLESLAQKLSPRVLRAPRRLDAAARELEEYFGRRRQAFDLPLDLSLSHGFRQLVQRHLPELVGNPAAVRAVGTACATNPLPVVVPCHRVLRADGSLGGYIGGAEAKTTLLQLEAA
jgi:methylated-DNA-[protein]-cysteine S-methyltransferase